MAEPANETAPSPEAGESRLRALHAHGAAQCEPLRLRHAELLAQRAQATAEGPLRDALLARRDAALAELEERLVQTQQTARDAVAEAATRAPAQARALRRLFAAQDYLQVRREAARQQQPAGASALAQLNQALRARGRGADVPAATGSASAPPTEMASVRQFREGWLRQSAQDQVAQATERQPAQAGPLNSQMLALRSLAVMRELSPDYLWRFLAQADTWFWLEQAGQRLNAESKPAARRGARTRKK